VDEFQDKITSIPIIKDLGEVHRQVFVVGDPDKVSTLSVEQILKKRTFF
jgi:hypothetical protein